MGGMTLSIDCNDTHYTALKILSDSSTPIGAWNLSRLMLKEGISVSEATAGRILRDLEDKGYVRAEGALQKAFFIGSCIISYSGNRPCSLFTGETCSWGII